MVARIHFIYSIMILYEKYLNYKQYFESSFLVDLKTTIKPPEITLFIKNEYSLGLITATLNYSRVNYSFIITA